jgi:uncharacterized protein
VSSVDGQIERVRAVLGEMGSVVVAFSGGADSAFLSWMAHDTLGPERAQIVTAVSPSLAGLELEDCAALADEWGLNWSTVETDEMAAAAYVRNGSDRCYWCKDALMRAVEPLLTGDGPTVVLGVNLDDLGEHRPGQRAASERGARFPLVEAELTKAQVREASRQLGLRTWDKPAAACLASRLPYGTPVTMGRLDAVGRAEAGLRKLGFRSLRVRHYGDTARIEVPLDALPRMVDLREEVVRAVSGAGFRYVTVDLEGLRSGNLNQGVLAEVLTGQA